MTSVIIVDDHALIRSGIRRLLEDEADIEVVAELENGAQLLDQYEKLNPDIVLLDLFMPEMGGIEAMKRLLRQDAKSKIIIVTMCDTEPYPNQLLQLGAMGYLSKNSIVAELVTAIKQIASGSKKKVISADLAKKLVVNTFNIDKSGIESLTKREFEIFSYLVDGKSPSDISQTLFISPKTVGVHRSNIMRKLNADSSADLFRLAAQNRAFEV